MARSPIQLGRPEIALRYRKAKTGWRKTRLLCAKLSSEGLLKRGKPGPQAGEFKLLKGQPRIKKQRLVRVWCSA